MNAVGGAKSNLSTAEEPVVFNHVETYKFCQLCGDSNAAVFFLKGKKNVFKPLHTEVRTGFHYSIGLSVCIVYVQHSISIFY